MTRSWRFALAGCLVALSAGAEQPSHPAAFGVLHDNGPFVNSPGTGAGGADESILQNASLGLSSCGFTHTTASGFGLAEDFTVPGPNGWWIDSVTLFGYQTGATLESPFTGAYVRIRKGPPNDGASVVVFGAAPTDGLRYTTWSGAYRVLDTAPGLTNRPIMANTVRIGTTLPPGQYWLDWSAECAGPGNAFAPAITINGQAVFLVRTFDLPLP